MASKAGKGSNRNNRDSNPKYLGVKIYGGEKIKAGNIILMQRGTKVFPGNNVGLSKDHSIYALINGIVKFERVNREKQKVSVYPA